MRFNNGGWIKWRQAKFVFPLLYIRIISILEISFSLKPGELVFALISNLNQFLIESNELIDSMQLEIACENIQIRKAHVNRGCLFEGIPPFIVGGIACTSISWKVKSHSHRKYEKKNAFRFDGRFLVILFWDSLIFRLLTRKTII